MAINFVREEKAPTTTTIISYLYSEPEKAPSLQPLFPPSIPSHC